MESLIAVGLGVAHPVAGAVRMGCVYLTKLDVDVEAVVEFCLWADGVEDDAHSEYIVDFLKGDMLGLHLAPDGIGRLDSLLYLVGEPQLVEGCADRGARSARSAVSSISRMRSTTA